MSTNSSFPRILKIENHESGSGKLNVVSFEKLIPFVVKRIFYVSEVESGVTRGKHSHKTCWQFLIPLKGTIEIVCRDRNNEYKYNLSSKSQGLVVPPKVWCEQHYKDKDSILLVLASEEYDSEDYIHDFQEFLDMI